MAFNIIYSIYIGYIIDLSSVHILVAPRERKSAATKTRRSSRISHQRDPHRRLIGSHREFIWMRGRLALSRRN